MVENTVAVFLLTLAGTPSKLRFSDCRQGLTEPLFAGCIPSSIPVLEFSMSDSNLGQVTYTDDFYFSECSIQQSSAIGDYDDALDRPGSSAIWVGVNDVNPQVMKSQWQHFGLEKPEGEISGWMPYPIPSGVHLTTRMHLNREQVAALVERLQEWLNNGEFEKRENGHESV